MKIRNLDELASHGDSASRRIVLEIAERTLARLDSYERIRSIAHMDGDSLHIGTRSWDLSTKRNVYLVGGGKAANHMARAVDAVLADRLTKGLVIVKVSEEIDREARHTEFVVGGHPIPNAEGMAATQRMLDLVDAAGPDDLFIGVISGGSSALMTLPVPGITLQDEKDATDVLLKSGAGIYEINAVRRHISQVNGGRLAQRIQARGAEFIGFGISDAVGNPRTGDIGVPFEAYASTPIGPDRTTLEDARSCITDHDLRDSLPASIVDYLFSAGPEQETPKAFPDNTYFLLNTLPDSCAYAQEIAEDMGIHATILTSFLEGESKDAGTIMASIAREIQAYGNPVAPPCVVLSSGETTTAIPDSSVIRGHGGPGQELTASFAIAAPKIPGAVMYSMDSEGTDGTTPVAGGITDSTTAAACEAEGISLHAALREHSCYEALRAVGDVVVTGNTGTNLCDLNILYVPAR
jgi:glycerate-2-kinase